MGKWSDYDTDQERLPSGMRRIAYDADTQVYTYRDKDGSLWEGAAGATYGTVWPIRSQTPRLPSVTIENPTGEEKDQTPLPDDAYEFLMLSDHRQRERRDKDSEGESDEEKRPRSRYKQKTLELEFASPTATPERRGTVSGFVGNLQARPTFGTQVN